MPKTRRKKNRAKHSQGVRASRKRLAKEASDAKKKAERNLRAATYILKLTSKKWDDVSVKLSDLERALRGER